MGLLQDRLLSWQSCSEEKWVNEVWVMIKGSFLRVTHPSFLRTVSRIVFGMNVLTKHARRSRIISPVSRCPKPFERCGCRQGLRANLYLNRSIPRRNQRVKISLWCPWECGSRCLIGWHVLHSAVLNDACVMGFPCRYFHGWFKADVYQLDSAVEDSSVLQYFDVRWRLILDSCMWMWAHPKMHNTPNIYK